MLTKRLIATAVLSAALAFGVAGAAHADVPRNQITTLQYQVTVAGTYVHSYTINPDPCGPTFTGTGQYPPAPGAPTFLETLSGSVSGNSLTYTAVYYDPNTNLPTGYQYTFTGTFTDPQGDIAGTITDNAGNVNLPTTGTFISSTSTNFKNHGDYVNSLPASKRAAAQSCVGMPVQSNK